MSRPGMWLRTVVVLGDDWEGIDWDEIHDTMHAHAEAQGAPARADCQLMPPVPLGLPPQFN